MERYALSDTAILSALVDGVIDVGFVHGEYESDELRFVPYSKVDMRVLALKGNPICAKAPLRISDLREIPIRSPLDFDLFTKHFIARCKACGFDPLYCEVSLNDDAIEQFMAEGGVHIQPYDPRMKKAFPEMDFMSFHPDDKDDLPLCLAYSARCDNRFAQKFVKYFKDNVRRAIRHSADS